MSLTHMLIGSISAGLAIVLVAFVLSLKLGQDERRKFYLDTLMKAAIVIFGISFGFFTFFAQKAAEEASSDLDQANDALVGFDAFVSNYDSAVAAARVDDDNDDGFPDLLKACLPLKKACDANRLDVGGLTVGDLEDMEAYLNSPYLEKFEPDLIGFTEQKPLLKKVIEPDQITKGNEHQIWIVQEYQTIKSQIEENGRRLAGTTQALLGVPREKPLRGAAKPLQEKAFLACCDVIDMNDHSLALKHHGCLQDVNMCRIRKGLSDFLLPETHNPILDLLAWSRVEEMKRRIGTFAITSTRDIASKCTEAEIPKASVEKAADPDQPCPDVRE